ncbi:hypothetical protein BCD48_30640 [Pseudofrankia sp. BMG5.36]|nr:hypothetical protein BCD48_30640 [Pseudofrankia sp. BMG5.36]
MTELTADQEMLRETTARFLAAEVPVDKIRGLRADAAGFDLDFWRRGAELGWTSLLVSEADGGGSVSGSALADLCMIAHEFGARAAPGPLVATNVVAAALSAAGEERFAPVLESLLSGASVASWCHAEPSSQAGPRQVALRCPAEGGDVVLNGVKRPVEAAGQADYLLVTGRAAEGLTQVLVPVDTAGVSTEPMRTIDLTRRFSVVRFNEVRLPASAVVGELGGAAAQIERQAQLAAVLGNAEAVGALQAAFDMTGRTRRARRDPTAVCRGRARAGRAGSG